MDCEWALHVLSVRLHTPDNAKRSTTSPVEELPCEWALLTPQLRLHTTDMPNEAPPTRPITTIAKWSQQNRKLSCVKPQKKRQRKERRKSITWENHPGGGKEHRSPGKPQKAKEDATKDLSTLVNLFLLFFCYPNQCWLNMEIEWYGKCWSFFEWVIWKMLIQENRTTANIIKFQDIHCT